MHLAFWDYQEQILSPLCMGSFQVLQNAIIMSPQSHFLKAKRAQLFQSFLTGLGFQSPDHPCGPPLNLLQFVDISWRILHNYLENSLVQKNFAYKAITTHFSPQIMWGYECKRKTARAGTILLCDPLTGSLSFCFLSQQNFCGRKTKGRCRLKTGKANRKSYL